MQIIKDMDIELYHSHPSISKSQLDRIAISPAHYKFPPEKRTKATDFGAALHDYVLSPDLFASKYLVKPQGFNATRKADKELQTEWLAMGLTLISHDDFQTIEAMRKSIMALPKAKFLLTGGEQEVSHFWTDADTGIECRCRPDYTPTIPWLVDLKSTVDAAPRGFSKSCANYRYHVQNAFYVDGVEATTGEKISKFMFLAVEKESPYAAALYELEQTAVDFGRALYKRDLETYAEAKECDSWQAYGSDIQTINLPAWAYTGA